MVSALGLADDPDASNNTIPTPPEVSKDLPLKGREHEARLLIGAAQ
jgi:hypothetical protein